MTMTSSETEAFFEGVRAASEKAIWCALATSSTKGARVRMIHPTWEGRILWFATGPSTAKIAQIKRDPRVELQYQVAPPDFIHVVVRGVAKLVTDEEGKRQAWTAIDYDLTQFGSTGPDDPNFLPVKIEPLYIEHSEMFGSMNKKIWRAEG